MAKSKENEVVVLNAVLGALSIGALLVVIWTVATDRFRSGIDMLFLIFVCLLLAGLFAINPLIWAMEKGFVPNPFNKSAPAEAAPAHGEHAHGGSNAQNILVWGGLLFLTAIEVFLAYIHLNLTLMLIILMGLSIIKAALIMAYFMHLKFERLSLVLTIVPALVVLLCLFVILFPDSFRMVNLRG
ncbi:MAG TPA: cytochrome C oxidase subunit IV family protein [Blastocatellia bacterium]|jgi:cytochrome c oxidase subunit 4|nr:cytochrome C oxidase subunit IV family protein [Blastocatellia bacterium]